MAFRLARLSSKSRPTILSMLMKTPNSFEMKGDGPYMAHVTRVPAPCACSISSALLCAEIGAMKSSWMTTLESCGLDDLHAAVADLFVAFPFVVRALAAGIGAVGLLHVRVHLLPGGPCRPAAQIVDVGEDFFRGAWMVAERSTRNESGLRRAKKRMTAMTGNDEDDKELSMRALLRMAGAMVNQACASAWGAPGSM